MNRHRAHFLAAAMLPVAVLCSPAYAADKPEIAPAPAWIKRIAPPAAIPPATDVPVTILLSDQQIALAAGSTTTYVATTMRIDTPQGLSAGNISIAWRPDTDTLTVHRLAVKRGTETIDVLASQSFTVMRREQNLENAMLDGVLTANIQPEGLQVGDVLDVAYSITSRDPVMRGHVEMGAAAWNAAQLVRAHIRAQWPSTLPVRMRQSTLLPALKPTRSGDLTTIELTLDGVTPPVLPNGAPPRYRIGRIVELSDFPAWADLAALMVPLYDKAAVIAPKSALRTELERIAAASADPRVRAQAALSLVQDRTRYVALSMGAGGIVPTDAETTWARRFGDCKAKTAILIALLRELGIEAVPVLVNASGWGDSIAGRLPLIALFDHVLVRAQIGGKTYWLDGTRTGDTNLDRLEVPSFGWGLPVTASGATLVKLQPEPLRLPTYDVAVELDATKGITAPVPAAVTMILRGDDAIGTNRSMAALTGATRDQALRAFWRKNYNFIEPATTTATFDPATGEMRLTMTGSAKMDWSSGWYETDGTSLGYKADFSREAGPDRDAPFAVSYPFYNRNRETIRLPVGFSAADVTSNLPVNLRIAGVEYKRQGGIANNVFTIEATERSIAPEFPASEAPAAQATLREMSSKSVQLRRSERYLASAADVKEMLASEPATAAGFIDRGNSLLDRRQFDEALTDFNKALALEPGNAIALADRAIVQINTKHFDLAERDLAAAEKLGGAEVIVLHGRGLIYMDNGDLTGAEAAFSRAIERDPTDTFALSNRAELRRYLGNDDGALADIAVVLASHPDVTALRAGRAEILARQGKRAEAIAELNRIIPEQSDTDSALLRPMMMQQIGLRDEAVKAYDAAIASAPSARAYYGRAMARERADTAGKMADLDAALRLKPTDEEALIAKAMLLIRGNQAARAITLLTAGLRDMPDNRNLLVQRGIAATLMGNTAAAARDFAKARRTVIDPMALNYMCWAKATAGTALDSALADCDAALAKLPGNAAVLDSKALVLLRLGRTDEAIAAYDQALAKNSFQPSSRFGRSIAWSRKGDTVHAAADRAAALRVQPNLADVYADYGMTQ